MEKILSDQVAVVTGGNAGIGRVIAETLAVAGAKVVIFGTNAERGATAVEEIVQAGGVASFAQVDVSSTESVAAAIKSVVEDHGRIDILVNNAGVTADNLLMRMSEQDWDRVLEVNLKSCFNTCKAVMRPMVKARRGKIVNISSVVGLTGNAGQANYAASKAGMVGFSKSLAQEMASRNINVNVVCPGFIETKMTDALNDKQKEAIFSRIPMGRMGTTQEVADLVLFLASSRADYITGQAFTVDGGMVM